MMIRIRKIRSKAQSLRYEGKVQLHVFWVLEALVLWSAGMWTVNLEGHRQVTKLSFLQGWSKRPVPQPNQEKTPRTAGRECHKPLASIPFPPESKLTSEYFRIKIKTMIESTEPIPHHVWNFSGMHGCYQPTSETAAGGQAGNQESSGGESSIGSPSCGAKERKRESWRTIQTRLERTNG